MKNKHMTYALKNNRITYIDDVEKGLKCGCVCPACGEALIAKQGNKLTHHFAHRSDTDCEYGYQTSLHLAAKEILSNAKRINLPQVILNFPGSSKSVRISDSVTLDFDKIELEKNFGGIIPDIVAYKGDRKLFIEVYVTHKIGDSKLVKIKKADISTIEIDLSKMNHNISREELTHVLLSECSEKKWVYNKKCKFWLDKFYERADKMQLKNRGLAIHADWCPISARNYKGKPYANYMDDCSYCEFNIGVENDTDGRSCLYCTGRQRISDIKDFYPPSKKC
ncbi:MAG: hypothetical protein K6F76_07455 [Clostridiales bacterium]|nr:hypothetical protein [Clostridiales bacterium]